MAARAVSEVLQHLRRAVRWQEGVGPTDGQLLGDYLGRRDQAALAALVRRHGPMVWGVCRRVLRNHHDAEDAFQATFLVFVRRAASIARRDLLANWLYGVAHQTARKARATAARRRARERQMTEMPEPAVTEPDRWSDLWPLLDEELSRLPARYRTPIVLCDLEGRTRKEAARELGCPEGTVAGRLARARALLARRLVRRGVVLSGGALAAALSHAAARAALPPAVLTPAIRAITLFAAGQTAAPGLFSARAAVLTEGVLKAMLLTRLKTATAVVLAAIVLIVLGSGATALLAGDEGGRVGYQPPGMSDGGLALPGVVVKPGQVALDANGGRNRPYFYSPPDPANVNHLWELRKTGDYCMILPKVGENWLALDANAGKGKPYFRNPDPSNINHLWKLTRVDACYLIVPKVGEGEVALDANGGKGNPSLRKLDATNDSQLWELHKVGDYYMLVPLVRRAAAAPPPAAPPRPDVRREIERLVKQAEAAGRDRQATLEEIEQAVRDMKGDTGFLKNLPQIERDAVPFPDDKRQQGDPDLGFYPPAKALLGKAKEAHTVKDARVKAFVKLRAIAEIEVSLKKFAASTDDKMDREELAKIERAVRAMRDNKIPPDWVYPLQDLKAKEKPEKK